jgi:hypothetical protein
MIDIKIRLDKKIRKHVIYFNSEKTKREMDDRMVNCFILVFNQKNKLNKIGGDTE